RRRPHGALHGPGRPDRRRVGAGLVPRAARTGAGGGARGGHRGVMPLAAVTLAEIERIFAILDRLGLSREAVVIPLRPAHPGGVVVELEGAGLPIEGRGRSGEYDGLKPLYVEYGVGGYYRRFTLGEMIDRERIKAQISLRSGRGCPPGRAEPGRRRRRSAAR